MMLGYINQVELARSYPNLFRLLWQSTLPCYPPPEHSTSNSVHMLRQCSWQGKEVDCSKIFTPVITDSGVCCAFNLGSDLKTSNYSNLVTEMQVSFGTDLHILKCSWFLYSKNIIFERSPRKRQEQLSLEEMGREK